MSARCCPTGVEHAAPAVARARARARRDDPAAARAAAALLRHQQSVGVGRVSRAAARARVRRRRRGDRNAGPARLPRRAVGADARVRRSCCSAAQSAHYTASKLYPALLARRPILALFHEASSVVSILRATASEPTVRVVAYGDDCAGRRAGRRGRLSPPRARRAARVYDAADVVARSRAEAFSARSLAQRLAAVFDRVAA